MSKPIICKCGHAVELHIDVLGQIHCVDNCECRKTKADILTAEIEKLLEIIAEQKEEIEKLRQEVSRICEELILH